MINGILPFQMGEQHFRCEMQYDKTKPYELTFVFRQACRDLDCKELHEMEWVISRELLTEGLDSETWVGEGDVKIRRDSHNTLQIQLSPYQTDPSIISVPRRTLKQFIDWSYTEVKAGAESEQYNWETLDAERALW